MPDDIFFQRTQKIVEKTDASKKYFGQVVPVLTEGLLMGKQSPSKDNFRYLGNFLLDKSQMLPLSPNNNTPSNNQIIGKIVEENPKNIHEKTLKKTEIETTNPTMNIDEYIAELLVEKLERHLENKVNDDDEKYESIKENQFHENFRENDLTKKTVGNNDEADDKIKVVLDKTAKTILNDGILALNEERPTNPLNYLGEYFLKKAVVPERERGGRRGYGPWHVKTFDSYEYFKNPEQFDQSLSDPTSPWVTVPMTYEEALEEFSRYL